MISAFSDGECLSAPEGVTCHSSGITEVTIYEARGFFLSLDELDCGRRGTSITCLDSNSAADPVYAADWYCSDEVTNLADATTYLFPDINSYSQINCQEFSNRQLICDAPGRLQGAVDQETKNKIRNLRCDERFCVSAGITDSSIWWELGFSGVDALNCRIDRENRLSCVEQVEDGAHWNFEHSCFERLFQ